MAISTIDLFPSGGDIKVLQYITTSIVSTTTFTDVTLDNAVDLSKTWVIILNASSTVTNRVGNMVTPTLTSTTNARFTKGDSDGGSDVVAIVVSSETLLSLQYVSSTITGANASVAITIASVDSVNNLVVPFLTGTRAGLDGANSGVFEVWPTFTPSATMTTVTANRNATGGNSPVGVYVAEFKR